MVRREYHLRGCRPLTPGERDFKHCLYAHLKYCTAPCVGNVSLEAYLAQVKAACDFLAGRCGGMREELTAEMQKASAAQEYERAAQLRDLLTDLRRTTEKVNRFERMPYSLPLALDADKDLAELAQVLQLPAPPQRIEGFDISNISGTFKVASLVSFRNGRPDRSNYRRFKIKSVIGQDDFASVAEVVRRRYTRVLKETREAKGEAKTAVETNDQNAESIPAVPTKAAAGRPGGLPDLILIDGGKGQLGAACAELNKLGLSHIPIIGLAKEYEEIHRPGASEPLRLSQDTGALKLLQRVRDESHRLANTYNAELRLRKISESMLDEFPSLGEKRKAALLKKFGSVQRLRLATVEQIAEVSGFGGKAAGELKAFLLARQDQALPTPEAVPPAKPPDASPAAH
jgi:excinuclease ABC subunit C